MFARKNNKTCLAFFLLNWDHISMLDESRKTKGFCKYFDKQKRDIEILKFNILNMYFLIFSIVAKVKYC